MLALKTFKTFGLSTILVFVVTLSFAKNTYGGELQNNKSEINKNLSANLISQAGFFELNAGQFDSDLIYRSNSPTACVDFYDDRIVFSLRKMNGQPDFSGIYPKLDFEYAIWEIELLGNKTEAIVPKNLRKLANVNYFNAQGKNIGKKVADEIVYQNIYPNIDLKFYRNKQNQLKYDFILNPGANLSDIQLRYEGVESLNIDKFGKLEYQTEWGTIVEDSPFSYLESNNEEIGISYKLNSNVLSFVSDFETVTETIVIDPIYVDWSTYFYGSGNGPLSYAWTWVLDLDIDDSSNLYVTGMTSDQFPANADAYDTSISGYYDAYICKMTPNGDSMLWFSYIGGTSYDYSFTLTVNELQEPVIAGFTNSNSFPITAGAYDDNGSGFYYKGFVSKFTKQGDSLIYSTFLGGSGYDLIQSMDIDASGNVYITGETSSGDFPTTSGCFQSTYGGKSSSSFGYGGDAFLCKLNANGTSLLYSSYIGGAELDGAYEVKLSPSNEIYLVGKTSSGNFPVTAGSSIFNPNIKGSADGFIMKFQTDMKTLVYSKMMGGSGEDWFESVYINNRDEAYVAGISASSDFYTTSSAYQKQHKGLTDIVVVKFNSLGQNVYYSTYLGGSGDEKYYQGWIYNSNVSISANVREEPIICGISRSNNFPVTGDALMGVNPSSTGGGWWNTSAVIAKLDYRGANLLYGTYFGGSSYEIPGANKLKRTSCYTNILYGGITASTDYPTTADVYKPSKSGSSTGYFWTGFISKFRDTLYTDLITLSNQDTIIECNNVFEILDAKNEGADILWSDGTTERYKIVKDTGNLWVSATYGCDTMRDTIRFELEYTPTVPVLPNDSIYCDNFPNITLDAKNDTILAEYEWNSGETTQLKNINKAGKYWVNITTPHCGDRTDTVFYVLRETPDIGPGFDSIFCDEIDMQLKIGLANNNEQYYWSTGDSINTINLSSDGTYIGHAYNFCGIDSAVYIANLNLSPSLKLPEDSTFCNSVNWPVKIGLEDNNETYVWSDINNAVVVSVKDSAVFKSDGLFMAEISNSCGVIKDTLAIDILVTPKIKFGEDSIYCDNLNYNVIAGNVGNEETYTWENGSNSNARLISDEGQYWLEIKNKCGRSIDSIRFIKKVSPVAQILNGSQVLDDSVFCDVINIELDASLDDPDASYKWNIGQTTPKITATSPQLYKVTITSYCGTSLDSIELGLIESPTVDLGEDRIFCGSLEFVDLTVGMADNNEKYLWNSGVTQKSTTITSEGKHWVQLKNKCGTASDTLIVRVSPFPIVDLGPDTTLCGNFDLVLDAENEGMNYEWLPYGESGQKIHATEQRLYTVKVTNKDNCSTTEDFEILSGCVSEYYIPSAFSPNGDNINNEFKPTLVNYENYTMRIFNRWGEMLFETNNIDKGWDGTYKGEVVQNGVYVYHISFRTTEEEANRDFHGVLHLVR